MSIADNQPKRSRRTEVEAKETQSRVNIEIDPLKRA
jgi:riboflavin synthase alpha subunit